MSGVIVNGSSLGTALGDFLLADDLQPGSDASYQLCKTIYLYHPLGAKMAESPIRMAQSQQREISIPGSPEDRVRKAFTDEWKAINADEIIANVMKTSRIYGVASLALLVDGVDNNEPIDLGKLASAKISFNVLDPLNTAGSLVLNQNPDAMDFQKSHGVSISGKAVHPSRCVVIMNEKPIYLGYTNSAFGYVGRSVYQRALFPMKSFVQSMITDDMVTRKAGLLVAKMKPQGSIIDNIMSTLAGVKRNLLKEAAIGNVISVGNEENIESLNLQNLEGPFKAARRNILENIAAASPMPAKLLLQESFAEGFGEGTEDAKFVAGFIDGIREEMRPLYDFFDKIVQHRAWNEEFFETIKNLFPDEYGKRSHKEAFYEWSNAFDAAWPSLLREPDSEKIKVEETKFKSITGLIEVFFPNLDPENKATMIDWACQNFNEHKLLFSTPLNLDIEAIKNFTPSQQPEEPHAPKPFADSAPPFPLRIRK